MRDWFGVVNVEGDGPPIAIFACREDAEAWLATQQARTDDDCLDPYHVVVAVRGLTAKWWNGPPEELDAPDLDPATAPIEDVRADLKRRGIDTGPAFERVREALKRRNGGEA